MDAELADIDIVVLAGGLGTRLRSVVHDRPKILAPVGDRPFLDHLLAFLHEQGARRIILALGVMAEQVEAHLERSPLDGLDIVTSIEPEPLGTGGALVNTSRLLRSDPFLVMNGDTFVGADLRAFVMTATALPNEAALLAVRVEDASRYGRLVLDRDDRIRHFEEKGEASGEAWINGGIYLFQRHLLDRLKTRQKCSLERDLLEALEPGTIMAVRSDAEFVDIGTPESLALAPHIIAAARQKMGTTT